MVADIEMVGPNGEVTGPVRVMVWNRPPLGPGVFARAVQAPTIGFSASQAAGRYLVNAKVADRVAGVTRDLSQAVDYR